ncbi:MAG: DUF488 domain-containing protein [Anaerohalosphaeraceae bacterium]
MKPLFTIGYEGKTIDNFIAQLKQHSINCLLDVREIPLSRKKGFSKTALGQFLVNNNIQYIHFPKLGSPKQIRNKYKSDHNFESFSKEMITYFETQTEIFHIVSRYIHNNTCCLMCFEQNAKQCHRSIVAKKIRCLLEDKIEVKNIS